MTALPTYHVKIFFNHIVMPTKLIRSLIRIKQIKISYGIIKNVFQKCNLIQSKV